MNFRFAGTGWRGVLGVGLICSGVMIAGCEGIQKKKKTPDAQADVQQQAIAAAVAAQAQRLEQLRLAEEARRAQAAHVPEVIWLDDSQLSRAAKVEPAQVARKQQEQDEPAATTGTTTDTTAANTSVEPVQVTAAVAAATQERDLFTLLLADQRQQQGDGLTRALNIAAIMGMTGQKAFDPRDLERLSQQQQQRVQHFHQVMDLLRQQVASPGGAEQYDAIMTHLEALMKDVPLYIRRVELSRSVSSYGVMQPLPSKTFLAGRAVPMIVYVELDHFKSVKGDNGKHVVKLAQELVLYNEADGLAVWRQPQVNITDESLNRRRDFFVVQRIELPARLGVGKYLLKITMTDQQGGSIDEATVPIQIVADPSLVKVN